jgi:hypothetical protein
MMILHSLIIAVVLYLIMMYGLKQSQPVSIDRSILIGGIALVYMVLFGHNLPTKVNPNIY